MPDTQLAPLGVKRGDTISSLPTDSRWMPTPCDLAVFLSCAFPFGISSKRRAVNPPAERGGVGDFPTACDATAKNEWARCLAGTPEPGVSDLDLVGKPSGSYDGG